jgi:PKHD-type hydroxylase
MVYYPISPPINDLSMTPWYNFPLAFTPEECDAIIRMGDNLDLRSGSVGTSPDEYQVATAVRNVKTDMIPYNPQTAWAYDKVRDLVVEANNAAYKYDISGIPEGLQFLEYNGEGHYHWHIDTGQTQASRRKLTVIIQLSDPEDYEGCNIELFPYTGNQAVARARGNMIVFPSFWHHRVTPLLSGCRRCVVAWIQGPPFR